MRKDIISKAKKITAVITSTAMLIALFAGIGKSMNVQAEDNLLTGAKWTHTHEAWETNDALVGNTSVKANNKGGFTANISITGWQREWYGVEYMPADVWAYQDGWCDKPYQLTSDTIMSVEPKSTYEMKFEVNNTMTAESGEPTEKNITVTVKSTIEGDNDNVFLFTTIRVPKNGSLMFDKKFTVPETYKEGTVKIEFAYGAYAYSYAISSSPFIHMMPEEIRDKYVFAPGTTENVNASGKLDFSNIEAFQVPYEEPTTEKEETTTKAPEITTKAPTTTTKAPEADIKVTPVVKKKPARPSIKVKNIKKKRLQITWRKVKKATKYQVRVVTGKKKITKTTKKTKIILKRLQKKTYKVTVRAYNKAGYGKWSKVKRVKVKK